MKQQLQVGLTIAFLLLTVLASHAAESNQRSGVRESPDPALVRPIGLVNPGDLRLEVAARSGEARRARDCARCS